MSCYPAHDTQYKQEKSLSEKPSVKPYVKIPGEDT